MSKTTKSGYILTANIVLSDHAHSHELAVSEIYFAPLSSQ